MAVKNSTYNIQEVGLAKALVRKGHSCDILCWTDKQEERVMISVDGRGQVQVFYRHGKTKFKNTVFAGCNELFSQYDILQPGEYNQIQAWILAKNQPHKTVIYHGPYYSSFNKRYNLMCRVFDMLFLKQYIRQGTQFLAKSELAKEFLTGKGIQKSNVRTVGVGIDTQMLSDGQTECKEPLYQAMKNDTGGLKLLYIGRFEKRRNIPFIIDVFSKVLNDCEDAKLYMAGTGDKGYLDAIVSYMKKVGINDRVIWQERVEQRYLSKVYQLADFFLLPTEYEIFGMVLLEAMYYETVVLTSRNGGSSTLIEEGKNGFIIESQDACKWAECILRIYRDDKRKKIIQQNAARTIAGHYTWDGMADDFIAQYQMRAERR